MGMTIGEKIIARAAKVDQVKAGEIHTIEVDRLMSNDGTTHLTIDMYHNQLKHPKIADKDKLVFIMDHNVPAENPKTAAAHRKMRNFAKEHEIKLYEGKGVCHQIMVENHVCPGEFIMGADSLDYFDEWKHPEIICEKAVVLVAVRDHWNMEDVKKKIHAIEQLFHAKIYPLSCDRFDAASRNIRQMIKKGEDTGQLVPDAVSQFIKEHHLYENEK